MIWVLGYVMFWRESDGGIIWYGYIKDIIDCKEEEYLLIKVKERVEIVE